MLKVREKISEKKAKQLILDLVKKSDHSNRSKTDGLNNKQIEKWFEQNGYPFKRLNSDCRSYGVAVPFVENIMNSTYHVGGGETSVIDFDGNVQAKVVGAGSLNMSDYQAKFESAMRYRDLAIKNMDIEDYYSCLSKLFASLESYFNYKASIHNQDSEEKLIDSKESLVSLEDKIRDWVPVLSPGKQLDRGNRAWSLFKEQLAERNDHAIHPKSSAQGISYDDFAKKLNELRDGVVKVTFEIYELLEVEIKSQVIRAAHYPDVYATA